MNTYGYILFIIIFVLFVANYNYTEHLDESRPHYCSSCSDKTFGKCMMCSNCAFKKGKCVFGDVFGNSGDIIRTDDYIYNDQFWQNARIQHKLIDTQIA